MRATNKIQTNVRQILKNKGLDLTNEVGEVGLIYTRKHKTEQAELKKVYDSNSAKEIIFSTFSDGTIEHREFFKILALNRANKVIAVVEISAGGISGTVADPKIMFQAALLLNASSIIACHNHPSGNLKPSQADINLTKKIKEAGQILELPLLDHIIITPDSQHFSFADEGIL